MESKEGEELEIGDLDLQGIAYACDRQEPEAIPPKRIQLLKESLHI